MSRIYKWIYFSVLGWRLNGTFPEVSKCVIVVAPHTSWIDFALALLIRKIIAVEINFIGKAALFRFPFGWFFRWTGGAPVDRSKNNDTVTSIAEIFEERTQFRLALAPEGTRKKVTAWKTGYYYIALKANVPLVRVAFDFGKKEVKIAEPFTLTGNYDQDYKEIMTFYDGVEGYKG